MTCGAVARTTARLALDRTLAAAGVELRKDGPEWYLADLGPALNASPLILAANAPFAHDAPGTTERVDGGYLLIVEASSRIEALSACPPP